MPALARPSLFFLFAVLVCTACASNAHETLSDEEKLCRELSPTGCLSHLGQKDIPKPERLAMLMSVGEWHLAQSDFKEAIDYFGMLNKLDPNNGHAHQMAGDAYFGQALQSQRQSDEISKMMADADFALAGSEYREAMAIDPADPKNYQGAIRSFALSGHCDLAKRFLAKHQQGSGDAATKAAIAELTIKICGD